MPLSRNVIEQANTEVMPNLEVDHSQRRTCTFLSVLVCSCCSCLKVRQLSCRFHAAIHFASIVHLASYTAYIIDYVMHKKSPISNYSHSWPFLQIIYNAHQIFPLYIRYSMFLRRNYSLHSTAYKPSGRDSESSTIFRAGLIWR